jgi:hypothetical protein
VFVSGQNSKGYLFCYNYNVKTLFAILRACIHK